MGVLFFAAAIGLVQGAFHRTRDPVRIHNHPPVGVARGPPDGLHQRGFGAQEAFFIRVEDRH